MSATFVRAHLRQATGANGVSPDAVRVVLRELIARFDEIAARAKDRYAREVELRAIHGLYSQGILQPEHVALEGASGSRERHSLDAGEEPDGARRLPSTLP